MKIVQLSLTQSDQFYKQGKEESHYAIEYMHPIVRAIRDNQGKFIGIQETEIPVRTLGKYCSPEEALCQIERMSQQGYF